MSGGVTGKAGDSLPMSIFQGAARIASSCATVRPRCAHALRLVSVCQPGRAAHPIASGRGVQVGGFFTSAIAAFESTSMEFVKPNSAMLVAIWITYSALCVLGFFS